MQSSVILLPSERYRQLAALASRERKSMADAVGDLLVTAIYEGRLDDQLPGWTIERTGDVVHLAIEETGIVRDLSLTSANSIADMLDKLAVPGVPRGALLDLDADLRVERVGQGIRFVCPESGEKRAVSRSVAQDVAHRLRRAAS